MQKEGGGKVRMKGGKLGGKRGRRREGRTLCFSRIPHFSRSLGWARSRWFRRWMALRMDDILRDWYLRCLNEDLVVAG